MGIEWCGCGNKRKPLNDPQSIRTNLNIALTMTNQKIKESELEKLDKFLPNGSDQMLELSQIVLIQQRKQEEEGQINTVTRLIEYKTESLLVGLLPMQINRLSTNKKINGQGIVVYSVGFYLGNISDNYAHGEGTFYFTELQSEYKKLKVQGKWENGQLLSARFFAGDEDLLLYIEFANTEKKNQVQFFEKGVKQPLFTYKGSIKDVKKYQLRKLEEIITGQGQISFSNGDKYIGGVKNGLMHTSGFSLSTYIQRSTQIQYKGKFVEGKRDGKGEILIPIFCSFMQEKEPFVQYKVTVQYEEGRLIEKQYILTKHNSTGRWTVDVEQVEGEIVLRIKNMLSQVNWK